MRRATSLYRSLAPWHPSAAWVWFTSLLVLASAGISHGFESGVRGGLTVALSWMITREIAPAKFGPALLAPFAAVAFAIPAETDIVACFAVLLAARIAARTVGPAPTLLDCILLVGVAAWAAASSAGLPAALVLAAILFADNRAARERHAGLVALAAILVVGSAEGTLTMRPEWGDPVLAAQVLIAIVAAGLVVVLVWPLPLVLRVRDDRQRAHLSGIRIRIARVAVVAALLATVAWQGTAGVFQLSAAAAALCAVAIGGAGQRPRAGGSGTLSP